MPTLRNPNVPNNFGGYAPNADAKIWLFGVPFDSTVCYLPGCRYGPKIIREASQQIETYDIDARVDIFESPGVYDLGDMEPVRGNAEKTVKKVEQETEHIVENKRFPLMLGGEHTITAGAVKALSKVYKDIKVLSFDAHPDLRDSYEGERYDHACVMRRVSEISKDFLVVGARSLFQQEEPFEKHIVFRKDIKKSMEKIEKFIKGANIYLTIDIDVLDPSEVPGVGTPEPDGLSFAELFELIKLLKNCNKIVGMDLVELRPVADSNISEVAAAKLLFKTIAVLKNKI
ncbi:MAG: agmatinase [Candidatus Aenigmatarchaeota archaeon]